MFPIIAPREPAWPQVPNAELLTAAMRQELPSGPTLDIDAEPPRAEHANLHRDLAI
jgi:hypothetical protein